MTPFWSHAHSPAHRDLLQAVERAHEFSAERENVSTVVVANAAMASGSYTQALAAGLATLGGLHAPVEQARQLLEAPDSAAFTRLLISHGKKAPGFGNSFYRGTADPHWIEVETILRESFPELSQRLDSVTAELHRAGRNLFPNPAAYTAAAAIATGCPRGCTAFLFVASRLNAWSRIIEANLKTI